MASHRTSITNKGFTLIEILVVLGVLGVVGGLGLLMSMDSYRAFSFHNERDIIVSNLQKARSQAVNNMCFGGACSGGVSHGLHLAPGMYTLFQGTTYTAGDPFNEDTVSSNKAASVSGLSDVVFSQLSGALVSTPGTIAVTDSAGHVSTITVNNEGRIFWDN